MSALNLHGTLLLDLTTIQTAPQFFSILALLLRATGMNVHVVGAREGFDLQLRTADFRVPYTNTSAYPSTAAGDRRQWKLDYAKELLARGPVIWVDLDFTDWAPGDGRVADVPGLITLNWESVRRFGIPPPVKGVQ